MPINEIQEFAATGTVENGDVMLPEAYAADPHRARGHQVGIGRRELENTVLRQLSRFNRGLAQFIASRYEPGVVDDGDEAKIVEGMEFAISEMIAAQAITVAPASETVAGIVKLATDAEAITGTDTVRALTAAAFVAGLTSAVRAYSRQHYFAPVTLASAAGTVAVDCDLHAKARLTLTEHTIIAAATHQADGKEVVIRITGANNYTLAWHATYKPSKERPLPSAPAAGKHITVCFESDGANMHLIGYRSEV